MKPKFAVRLRCSDKEVTTPPVADPDDVKFDGDIDHPRMEFENWLRKGFIVHA